jgi:hypothetical protein
MQFVYLFAYGICVVAVDMCTVMLCIRPNQEHTCFADSERLCRSATKVRVQFLECTNVPDRHLAVHTSSSQLTTCRIHGQGSDRTLLKR